MKRLVAIASLALLAGCVGPDYEKPDIPLPESFAAAKADPAIDAARWWRSLSDVELNSLIDRAVDAIRNFLLLLARLAARPGEPKP